VDVIERAFDALQLSSAREMEDLAKMLAGGRPARGGGVYS
jgi:hypothetical protein